MNSNLIILVPTECESKSLALSELVVALKRDISESEVVHGVIVWEFEAILQIRVDSELIRHRFVIGLVHYIGVIVRNIWIGWGRGRCRGRIRFVVTLQRENEYNSDDGDQCHATETPKEPFLFRDLDI